MPRQPSRPRRCLELLPPPRNSLLRKSINVTGEDEGASSTSSSRCTRIEIRAFLSYTRENKRFETGLCKSPLSDSSPYLCAIPSQTTSKALPKESSHVLFMTDSPPGENSLPLSLPLEEMEEERERDLVTVFGRRNSFERGGFSRRNFVGACRRR